LPGRALQAIAERIVNKLNVKETLILPSTSRSLGQLAAIRGDDRCVLTVYFSGSLSPSSGKDSVRLVELPAKLISDEGLTDDEAEHLRRSLALWQKTTAGLTLPPARGWVGVVSWMTEDVAFVQLPVPVEPAACLDNSPFLYPAGRLLDDFEAYAVVYADHDRAAIYCAALGKMRDAGSLRGEIKNHVRKGGWSQQRYERRRDREIRQYCQEMIGILQKLVQSENLRRIILAGDRILLHELTGVMAPDMSKLVVCTLPMMDGKSPHEIFRETLTAAAEEEKREELRLRDTIRKELASGGRAAAGPSSILAALREKRVNRLLVGPMKDVEFWRCGQCGSSGLGSPAGCSDCGNDVYSQSAANEFMDLAFAGGSRVEFTSEDLPDLDGVGALLRW